VLAVERSATIAAISTKELVTKDFAPDPNEDRVRKAGQLMARKLAGALALVTCKDALKSNLDRHLRLSLGESGFGDVSQVILR
jgi:CCR4-NOT transcription complex subunit 1